MLNGCAQRLSLRADDWPDPTFAAGEAIRMVPQYLFDRVCEGWNSGAGARPRRGHEDQAGVDPPSSEPLGRKRTEILHVVRDDSPVLSSRQLEDLLVRAAYEIGPFGDSIDVVAFVSEPGGDLGRELFVEKGLHAPRARRPAAIAARPREYSASFVSISSSISRGYSP